MESKICTYSEPKHRLQLVLISNGQSDQSIEIRYNRNILRRSSDLQYMRFVFVNYVHMICLNRESPLSQMT